MFGSKKKTKEKPSASPRPQKSVKEIEQEALELFLSTLGLSKLDDLKNDPNRRDDYQRTPLHVAIECNTSPKVLEFLLKNKADPNSQDDNGDTPLHFAAQSSNPKYVKILLKNKADHTLINTYAKTPLAEASSTDSKHPIEIYELLIKAGAKGCFWSKYDFLTDEEHKELIKLAVKHYPGRPLDRDPENNTIMHWAAHYGMVDEIQKLLKKQFPFKTRNGAGKTPEVVANEQEQLAVSTILHNAPPSQKK